MTRKSAVLTSLPAAATLIVAGAVLAQPAQAAARDGKCDSGEFCYYYNSDNQGSISDFTTSVGDYGTTQPSCYDFKGDGKGKGQCIKNQAASVYNHTDQTVRVYFNSNYAGTYQDIGAGKKANLNSSLKNQNASHHIGIPKPGSAETPRDDFDHKDRGFAHDQCTAFAAYRVASRTKYKDFQNYWKGQHFGDAGNWDNAAKAAGIKVDKTPKVGALAVNDIHVSSEDGVRHGHVAYINKVYSDGSFDVEEYNWNVSRGYGTRKHMKVSNVDPNFQWIVHFEGS